MTNQPEERLTQLEDIDFNPAERDRNAKIINEAFDQVLALEQTDNARLDEVRFRDVFLPFFAGDTDPQYKVTMAHWYNVARGDFDRQEYSDSMNLAGASYREVDIVDEKGNVLFTVPPIMDRLAVRTLKRERGVPSVSDVIFQAQAYSNLSPMAGQHHLDVELNERGDRMFSPNHHAYAVRWAEIFARYGRQLLDPEGKPVPLPGGTTATATPTTQSAAPAKGAEPIDPDTFELM